MRRRGQPLFRVSVVLLCAALLASACAERVNGDPGGTTAPNAHLDVKGDSGGTFDTQVKNALSDVMAFWTKAYPTIADGKSLPPLQGSLYSLDGLSVLRTRKLPSYAKGDACLHRDKLFIIDNAAYCDKDDSILWDRSAFHIVPVLGRSYGNALIALVFAHEFGHAIQHRIGVPGNTPTIDIESQADCAAGAFVAAAMKGQAPHFRLTPNDVDAALDGFLQFRDSTPESAQDVSHGNGFDRLSALEAGIRNGPAYCYSDSYYADREFTERGYTDGQDAQDAGNESLDQLLSPSQGIAVDLNKFWAAAGQSVSHDFRAVRLEAADSPPCASSDDVAFGYCPDDNTVYYDTGFAKAAYDSLSGLSVDKHTGNVRIVGHQPADFALGTLLAIAWGLAARHQFFDKSIDDSDALTAAICYAGAYSESRNNPTDASVDFTLSPQDLDEASSAVLNLVKLDSAFGGRSTTGLDRITAFVTGYHGGLQKC